ncbi:DUF6695 family protein [Sphingobacterium humi]|uniref:Uncharacterized protein n=1 Tax=Sphingobacterium humi TaxID=1796905 RepID=A0A6N8L198_9SPHI|nr:DUF6695 family protein [Sphingobacterium humi]MVZ62789.1 hypothetical protein [Sphingobacterium humi]
MHTYFDIAIPIAWPDQTARGDEAWFAFLKRIGLVKNLNFKIGHAAILLIERHSGQVLYFDFGRYICPRGYGRARSASSDPRLTIKTIAQFQTDQKLTNLEAILEELESMAMATHGAGPLYCSVAESISFQKAEKFAAALVDQGPVLYGALAAGNNSCSRYVAQIMCEGMMQNDPRISKILYPESLKASPISNVANANGKGALYCYEQKTLHSLTWTRWESLKFQVQQLTDNFSASRAKQLPPDTHLGYIQEPERPKHIPTQAQWLGGLGEGCWYALVPEPDAYYIHRYNALGELDYRVAGSTADSFDEQAPYQFTYKVHHQQHILHQQGKDIPFLSNKLNYQQIKQSI